MGRGLQLSPVCPDERILFGGVGLGQGRGPDPGPSGRILDSAARFRSPEDDAQADTRRFPR